MSTYVAKQGYKCNKCGRCVEVDPDTGWDELERKGWYLKGNCYVGYLGYLHYCPKCAQEFLTKE